MLRKGVILIILASMVLHCASRMNFLSYLFDQRQEIALALGLIDEIPIAMCHHDYEGDQGLRILTPDDSKSTLPSATIHAREITLFIQYAALNLNPGLELSATGYNSAVLEKKYTPPGFAIFHPPA